LHNDECYVCIISVIRSVLALTLVLMVLTLLTSLVPFYPDQCMGGSSTNENDFVFTSRRYG